MKTRNKKPNFAETADWESYRRLRSESMRWQFMSLRIGHLNINFVIRHMFERYADWNDKRSWKKKSLGIWFEKTMCVGTKLTGKEMFSSSNLCPEYKIGVNLLVLKFWFSFSWKVLHF